MKIFNVVLKLVTGQYHELYRYRLIPHSYLHPVYDNLTFSLNGIYQGWPTRRASGGNVGKNQDSVQYNTSPLLDGVSFLSIQIEYVSFS
jgi:hypothetical protein